MGWRWDCVSAVTLLGCLAAMACNEGKLSPDSQMGVTVPPEADADPAARRLWAVSRDGELRSLLTRSPDQRSVTWQSHGVYDEPARLDGVSAVSWYAEGAAHERAYYVNLDGLLRVRTLDGGVASWTEVNTGELLAGTTAAVVLSNGTTRVAAVSDRPPAVVCRASWAGDVTSWR